MWNSYNYDAKQFIKNITLHKQCHTCCIVETSKEAFTEDPASESQLNVCSTNEWKCSNGECINSEFVCDNTQDCVDGSDEDEYFCEKEPSVRGKYADCMMKVYGLSLLKIWL